MITTTTAPTVLRDVDPLLIDLDPTQPRQENDQEALDELAASVREQGIVTPLRVVAKDDGRFQLLYGDRRLRAAIANELPAVPCIVEETIPTWMEALDIQLTENLHRAELRPLEIAQTLWRRILGANIEALEEEQGDDGSATAQLLSNYLTPASQISALEDRLAALAGQATAADYFASGRVRVGRKVVLGRYGMAGWPESKLKKLFNALDVAPVVQDMLAGVDVSARALRDLKRFDPETQATIVEEARAAENGDVGTALRQAIDKRDEKKAKKGKDQKEQAAQPAADDTAIDDEHDSAPVELQPVAEGNGKEFVPDPQLAFLTSSGGSAAKLVTERPEPQRGSVPLVSKAGEWDDDSVLILEGALETVRNVIRDMGVLRLNERQIRRLAPLWGEVVEEMQRAGLEA